MENIFDAERLLSAILCNLINGVKLMMVGSNQDRCYFSDSLSHLVYLCLWFLGDLEVVPKKFLVILSGPIPKKSIYSARLEEREPS